MPPSRHTLRRGFTLIELLVVMALLAVLVSIVVPRYFTQVDHAKVSVLKQQLAAMREALDRFHGINDRYPETLDELVETRLLRRIPVDPLTERDDAWQTVIDPKRGEGIFDIHSSAPGADEQGVPYANF